MKKQKSAVLFLGVPPSLQADMRDFVRSRDHPGPVGEGEEFTVDPGILLPVELPPGETVLDPEKLSWEMILSGMLRVLSAVGSLSAPDGPSALLLGGEDEENPFSVVKPHWLDYYRRFVLTVKPGIYSEFTEAAILKARNGDFPLALEILDGLLGLFPGEGRLLLNRALALEEQADAAGDRAEDLEAVSPGLEDRYAEARAAYEKVLGLQEPPEEALFNGGFFFMKLGNFRRAKECFREFTGLSGDEERRERAEALLAEIESQGLEDETLQEASRLVREGREEEALGSLRAFLGDHPGAWRGWFILGWALRGLGRWEDGAAAFRKALELGGGGVDARNELAICLMEAGDYGAARRELEKALEEEPENIKIISNLGVLAGRNGDDDEAAAFFRIVLDLDPEDPVAAAFFGGTGN